MSSEYVAPARAPTDLDAIRAQDASNSLPAWNSSIAFQLGTALRTRLLTFPKDKPCVIDISTLTTPAHVLFRAVSHSGTLVDNESWVARKRQSVIRWGRSSWWLHVYFKGDEKAFADKMALGERAGEYAIHGGAVPVFVDNVDQPVAIVVVSGLKQEDDHMVVVEELSKLNAELRK